MAESPGEPPGDLGPGMSGNPLGGGTEDATKALNGPEQDSGITAVRGQFSTTSKADDSSNPQVAAEERYAIPINGQGANRLVTTAELDGFFVNVF